MYINEKDEKRKIRKSNNGKYFLFYFTQTHTHNFSQGWLYKILYYSSRLYSSDCTVEITQRIRAMSEN